MSDFVKPGPKLMAEAYQLAGELLLVPDLLTEGQVARLRVLLLDFLSEPQRFTYRTLRELREMAKQP